MTAPVFVARAGSADGRAAAGTSGEPRRRRSPPWGVWLLAAALVVFGWGVVRLIELRFDVGDIYAPYSSLRGDPLGTKVLYAALDMLPGLKVERNLRPLHSLGVEPMRSSGRDTDDRQTAVLYLGVNSSSWPDAIERDGVERLEEILRHGGRVIVTFLPATVPLPERRLRTSTASVLPSPARRSPVAEHIAQNHRAPDLFLRWGLDFRRRDLALPQKLPAAQPGAPFAGGLSTPAPHAPNEPADATAAPESDWPGAATAKVSWHSVLDFDLQTVPAIANRWQTRYQRQVRREIAFDVRLWGDPKKNPRFETHDYPVIVSRPFGESGGELICASDSYFLSNEALHKEPHPELLSAMIGPCQRIIFDENHLGVSETPGMMALARRYHLQGGVAVLLVLVALFVWRNVVQVAPPAAEPSESAPTVIGRDAASGFLLLLRRGVPASQLAAVCVARWKASLDGGSVGAGSGQNRSAVTAAASKLGLGAGAGERVQAALAAEEARPGRLRSPAAAYRAMCAAVRR